MSASSVPAGQAVMEFCQRVAEGLDAAGNCPNCASLLNVAFSIHGVRIRCPSGCFCFEFRRDMRGAFVSGCLDLPGQSSVLSSPAGP